MFITTSGRPDDTVITTAHQLAKIFHTTYVKRSKKSVKQLLVERNEHCIVVAKDKLSIHFLDGTEPFFFHPNSASFRIKRLLNRENDVFIDTCQLKEGMSFLDCTLGLGSDSIVAAFVVGAHGEVCATEHNLYVHYLVSKGLVQWQTDFKPLSGAMQRVKTVHASYEDYLKTCPDQSVDVIYFDPMFQENIVDSNGIQPMKQLASFNRITNTTINEAKRVAKQRIVMKAHFRHNQFEELGFRVNERKSALFHYGTIELEAR